MNRSAWPSIIMLAAAACGGAAAPDSGGGASGLTHRAAPARVARDGVSIAVPPGWRGRASRGRLELRSYAGRRTPRAGEVWAALDEFSRRFAQTDGLPYPPLRGRLTIRPGQFSSPALGDGDLDASRLFRVHGRHFQLAVVFGDRRPPRRLVVRLNGALATLRVRPRVQPEPVLGPPVFAAARGWRTGASRPAAEQPQGDQLCAWASTIPYRDRNACPIAAFTVDKLRRGDMVISVDVHRSWDDEPARPLPERWRVPAHVTTMEGGYRVASTQAAAPRYTVDIQVYVGRGRRLTTRMRRRAERELARLRLPAWPP